MLAFVYGTLTDTRRVDAVVDEWRFEGPAELRGLRRVEGRYPTLAPPAGSGSRTGNGSASGGPTVEGRLLRTPDAAALDAYEGVDRGLYVRVAVPIEARDGTGDPAGASEAAVYFCDPDLLGVDAGWPGEGPFRERVRRFVADRGVSVRAVDP